MNLMDALREVLKNAIVADGITKGSYDYYFKSIQFVPSTSHVCLSALKIFVFHLVGLKYPVTLSRSWTSRLFKTYPFSVGLRESVKALDQRKALLCVLAESTDEKNIPKLVEALCKEHNINLIKVSFTGAEQGIPYYKSSSYTLH